MTTHEFLVDGPAFWATLELDIAGAQNSVCIQTLTLEGDAAGLALADALIACDAPRRRILVDSFNLYFQSDRFVYNPANMRADSAVQIEAASTRAMLSRLRAHGVEVKYTNPAGVFMHRMLARDHKKLVLIDGAIAFMGGINFCDHNYAWHDMMLRLARPDVAHALTVDFNATWDGVQAPTTVCCSDIELLNLDGASNEATCGAVLRAIDCARREIQVISPYMTFPFTDALRRAVQRGVRVTVMAPAQNNRGFLTSYMRAEAARSGFDLWLYDGMTHLKAMLIDNAELIVGSSNFDWLTYHLLGEVMALTTNADIIASFRTNVLVPDMARSARVEVGSAWPAAVLELGFRIAARAGRMLCKPALRPAAPQAPAPPVVPVSEAAPAFARGTLADAQV